MLDPQPSVEEYRRYASQRVETKKLLTYETERSRLILNGFSCPIRECQL